MFFFLTQRVLTVYAKMGFHLDLGPCRGLFDPPTSNLDLEMSEAILQNLCEMERKQQKLPENLDDRKMNFPFGANGLFSQVFAVSHTLW